jgi:hypothetical protein
LDLLELLELRQGLLVLPENAGDVSDDRFIVLVLAEVEAVRFEGVANAGPLIGWR